MRRMRNLLRRLDRLGDTPLPIGKPWFRSYPWIQFGWSFRAVLWPIRWQGWAAFAAMLAWLGASAFAAVGTSWQPPGWLGWVWLPATLVTWLVVVGIKSELVYPEGSP